MQITTETVKSQTIENTATGQTYPSIQAAVNDAFDGDIIIINPGPCRYLENLNFKGKGLTLSSVNPDDSAVAANTIIQGNGRGTMITLSAGQTPSVIDGLTISGGTIGISCTDASPIISNCTIESSGNVAIVYWQGYEPDIIDSTILGEVQELIQPTLP